MSDKTNQTGPDAEDTPENIRAGRRTIMIIAGFFVLLIGMNATFFAIAFTNPPRFVDPNAPTVAPQVDKVLAPGTDEVAPSIKVDNDR